MRSQTILVNKKIKGFLIIELIIVISLFSLFIISTFYLRLSIDRIKSWSINELINLEKAVKISDLLIRSKDYKGEYYGNYSKIIKLYPFEFTKSNLLNSWGSSTCYPRIKFKNSKPIINNIGVNIGSGNKSTGVEIRNSSVYLVSDSTISSLPDLFIIDNSDENNPKIISNLNTGPGIASVAVAGPYLYLANTSSNSQLQIVDIHDRKYPYIISQVKLPLPNASSTPPRSSSIFYYNGYIFLGTNKWEGSELSIIDVSNPISPNIVGSFDTDTLINDIFVFDNRAYLATSDIYQMRILDVSQKDKPQLIETFTTTGWEVQQGNVILLFENTLALGRTVGGINRINNHEVFIFSTSTNINLLHSHDIPGGVYGLIVGQSNIILLTNDVNKEFQIWNLDLTNKLYEMNLVSKPQSMKCDRKTIYFVTGDSNGFITLKL